MFEKFGFGHVYFQMQALCALYAEGDMTGIVLDAGDGVSHCIPVYQGVPFYNQIKRLNVAGRHVTDYLNKLLLIRGYAFNSSADFETLREIKESMCYVAYDINRDRKLAQETTVVEKEYKLPDNTTIFVGRERFEAPECLFKPHLLEKEDDGICEMVYKSLAECPLDCQRELIANVCLSGGTTMFPGLSTRVEKELQDIYVENKFKGDRAGLKRIKIFVKDPPRRKHGVFIGASFVGKHMPFESWVSKANYAEQGQQILF